MRGSARLTIAALAALLVPGVLLAIGDVVSGVFRDTPLSDNVKELLVSWLMFTSPQLLVLLLAAFFPGLRRHFAARALIGLTVLFTCLLCLLSLSHDPNSFMGHALYFPLSLLVVLGVTVFTPRKDDGRGSNNRWRGP